MKVALITDTHYGFKKGNQDYHDYFLKFYNEVFFPTLKKKKIKHVIHLGDVFDIRRNIDFWSLDWARKNIFNPLQDMGVTVDMMVGNHDSFYKNTLEINSLECLLQEYANLRVYTGPSEVTVGGRKMVYLPWICDQNEEQTVNLMKETEAEVVLGHLEMEGFKTNPNVTPALTENCPLEAVTLLPAIAVAKSAILSFLEPLLASASIIAILSFATLTEAAVNSFKSKAILGDPLVPPPLRPSPAVTASMSPATVPHSIALAAALVLKYCKADPNAARPVPPCV